MPRRYDPDRRQRLIDAAIAVVGRDGIGALSHRAVAAEADVPLGSTTYHFATLDDLLVAALRQVNAEWLAAIERWAERVDPEAPLADVLAWLVGELLAQDRGRLVLAYELYLAALRRDAVRPIAAEWTRDLARLLRRRVEDPDTARALVALIDGLVVQHLLSGEAYDRDATRAALRRITG